MANARRAVIDVGTNSIKLLVADVAGRDVHPAWEESAQTRLGSGFYRTHRLQSGAIDQTAAAVARFYAKANELHAESVRVIATSAARDAVNPGDLTSAIQAKSGLQAEIISGEQEAEWVFRGVTTDPGLAEAPLLLLDVGGGSTEFILGQGDRLEFRASYSLGTVRLMEDLPHSDPPTAAELKQSRRQVRDFLVEHVKPKLEAAMVVAPSRGPAAKARVLVGTGGTVTVLARLESALDEYDRSRIEATRLSRDQVRAKVGQLWGMALAERRQLVGMPRNRADVILTGVVIYEAVMDELGFSELRVSTRGLRFAAVMEPKQGPV